MQIDKKACPPPGTYAPKTNLVDALPKQNSRAGGFGTKSTVRYVLFFLPTGDITLYHFNSDSILRKQILVKAMRVTVLLPV